MSAVYLLGMSVLMAVPSEAPGRPAALAAYEAASARVGRDAMGHVGLALWCETHGLRAESVRQLALATLIDPKNGTARGLMGMVAHNGQWQRPEAVAEEAKSDAALAEYNARRAGMPETADAHWKLASWCEQRGLKAEATAHLTVVTRLDPGRPEAWKRLGCELHKGRWMSPEQFAAERAEEKAQKEADRHWKLALTRSRPALRHEETREATIDGLAIGDDPRAVRAIWGLFGRGDPDDRFIALQMLRRIDSPAASHALAYLAARSPDGRIRPLATEQLTRRDPRDFVDFLIGLMNEPIRYQVRRSDGPGSAGNLFIEGRRYDVRRLYNPPSYFVPNPESAKDPRGNNNLNDFVNMHPRADDRELMERVISLARQSTSLANQKLQGDIRAIDELNRNILESNKRVATALRNITGQELGDEREPWVAWWVDKAGYAYERPKEIPKPTITQEVPIPIPTPTPVLIRGHVSCFAAGTPVRTLAGDRPIESLKIGDQVLTQDTTTGVLDFRPIVAVHHNPPAPTLKISVGDETIMATGIHRFWMAGKGWAMARDLRTGDTLRTLGGVIPVLSVKSDAVRPVFNLDVAGGRSFFVGGRGLLVHDNSLVQPVEHPFDAAPDLAAIGASAREILGERLPPEEMPPPRTR